MTLSHTSGLTKEAMDRLKAEYMKTQLQMAQQQAYDAAQQQERFRIGANGNVTLGAYTHIPEPAPTINLEEGAWGVPISQLVDLWIVRYGSKWVSHDELDDFYEVATERLKTLRKIESHYVNGMDVYRIVE